MRVREPDLRERVRRALQSGPFGWALVTCVVFVLVSSAVVIWSREQPLVAVGRVMSETRDVRVAFTVADESETSARRDLARQQTPRVFVADESAIEAIRSSLENLPTALAGVSVLEGVEPQIRERFRLTEDGLSALKGEASSIASWQEKVRRLHELLRERPLLDAQTWQRALQEGSSARIELRVGSVRLSVPRTAVVNISDPDSLEEASLSLARRAGFEGASASVVASRLLSGGRPTYRYDAAGTTSAQNQAASAVEPVAREVPAGTPIFSRGQRLSSSQYELHKAELSAFSANAEGWARPLQRLAVVLAVAAVALAAAVYGSMFVPRLKRNPSRMAGLGVLLGSCLLLSAVASATNPQLLAQTSSTPVLFAAVILAIAYDRRVALAMGTLLAVLVGLALRLPIGMLGAILAGVCVAAWRLGEVRDRRGLVAMALWTGLAIGIAVLLAGLIERPMTGESLRETLFDAALAALGAVLVGAVTLFVLPLVERAFDITTGMTLIELRDPKQPLLRRLQQRAPGTYNHSLNVASIAEAAADAIGADPLLTYVGALYHDIGKMNKPEYFVENQSGGPNRHDKLSPAMSLLVIVGHVKDGSEIAREYGLPRPLLHFIEAHHGTTLVEYFYQRARQKAEQELEDTRALQSVSESSSGGRGSSAEPELPAEVEYRYPGPRPRTKECAMLMLADAVESATRTLAEPTPSRIDQLVRTLANKRLLDGQFDDCDLTLRELHIAAESISKTVAAIYHGRIAYPTDKRDESRTGQTTAASGAR
ncbi:MAG: HDIG domain-containing protein [Phycisphaerales bacterium]|nr:MAG: HDIG domain-containing protein [Phycisphaerales bacterium]